jgi:hypothetical protein
MARIENIYHYYCVTRQEPCLFSNRGISHDGLLFANFSEEEETYILCQLVEGQTPFDWDHDGAKWTSREELPSEIKDCIAVLDSVAKDMAVINQFPQEMTEAPTRQSKILGTPTQGFSS